MKGTAALKKINAEAKRLKKKHPGKKYATLRKEAAASYNAGRLKPKRAKAKRKPVKRKRAKVSGKRKYSVTHRVKKVGTRKTARKRTKKRATTTRKRTTRTRTVTKTRYRRVGASSSTNKTLMTVVILAAVGVGAYLLLRKPATTTLPPLVTTGNTSRDTASTSLLQYAQAAGIGLSGIAALINAINNMSDSAVVSSYQQVRSGMDINTALAVPTGGPSITLGT